MNTSHIKTIAILGNGAVGQALAAGWTRAGRAVVFGVRAPAAENERTVRAAADAADVIVLAVPFAAIGDVTAAMGDCVGKVVIDCTNPLGMTDGRLGLVCGFTTSGAEQVAAKLPHARVVKTLNQTGAENLADATRFAAAPVMFVAGDDADAVGVASALVADLGFEPVAAGPLVTARLLEPFAMLWIDQALFRGGGRDFAFVRAHPQRKDPA